MTTTDREAHARAATEITELFSTLVQQRPEVLHALRALLIALTQTSAMTSEVDPPLRLRRDGPRDIPSHDVLATDVAVVDEPAQSLDATASLEPATPSLNIALLSPSLSAVVTPKLPPSVRAAPTAKDVASLKKLEDMFGGDIATSRGLGHVTPPSMQEVTHSRWTRETDEARDLARIVRAQARRLKALRLALHDKAGAPSVDGRLATARIHDWTTEPTMVAHTTAKSLKEGERWYALTAQALTEVAEWLAAHPLAELGIAKTPDGLRDRICCVAIAQKGIFCWLERAVGIRAQCGVQDAVFGALRHWSAQTCFAVYIPSAMQLNQQITSDERDEVVRVLARLELENSASTDDTTPDDVHAGAAMAQRKSAAAAAHGSTTPMRFGSVIEAFDAAQLAFGQEGDNILEFTERAQESAEDSAFKRPDDVYEFFEVLHGIARDLQHGALEGMPLDEVFLQRGFRKKPCSGATMKRYHRFYHMTHEQREVDLSRHVTLGSRSQNTCISIHWWHDEVRQRFIIGHCGRHLPNTRS